MRDLIITENITLDGVIDATRGWFDVGNDADLSDVAEALREHSAASDALLVGRSTFEAFRSFWPRQTDDETGVHEHLNRVHKYVVSSSLTEPGWEPTTVVGVDDVEALKAADGRDIVCTGSLTLVPELIARGLVDEFRLFVYPVVLGSGQRLFERPVDVRLAETRPFRSGIVLLRYRTG
jgi:dihydrofolate reductase